MAPSLPVAFSAMGVGAILLWSGFRDPEGGPVGELGRILRGEAPGSRPAGMGGVASIIPALAASGSVGGTTGAVPASTTPSGTTTGGAGAGAGLVGAARKYLGVPYLWGGESPKGMDCSGLVWYCCTHDLGMPSFPRTAELQQATAPGRMVSAPAANDLVFFGVPAHHVGVVVGDGTMIHAPYPGEVVKVESLSSGWATGQHKTYRRLSEGGTAT